MGGWDAVAASVGGVTPAAYNIAYGPSGGRNYRPVIQAAEYTDDTLIAVPVLETIAPPSQQDSGDADSREPLSAEHRPKVKDKGLSGFFRRRSLNPNALPNTKVNVTLRQVPWKEYQKHYLKDDHGRYMGTADPADDCILNEEDTARWRGGAARETSLSDIGDTGFGNVQNDVDFNANAAHFSDTASLPPRPSTNSTGKKSKFGLFKSNRGKNGFNGIVR